MSAVVHGYMSAEECCKRYGFSISTLRRGWYDGSFPSPVRLGRRRIGWRIADLREWEAAQPPHVPATRASKAGV